MALSVRFRVCAVLVAGWMTTPSPAQPPVPLADPVQQALLPAGITRDDVYLDAQLAYCFRDADETDAIHLVGQAVLRVGDADGTHVTGQELLIWITPKDHKGLRYNHIQVFIWKNGEVGEVGKTNTVGPALFVTLNSAGRIRTAVDDFTRQSSADSAVYQQGNVVRLAFNASADLSMFQDSALSVLDTTGYGAKRTKVPPSKPVIYFRSEGTVTGPIVREGLRMMTVIGGAYMSRGTPGVNEYLEIRADSVVVFLPPDPGDPTATPHGQPVQESVGLGGQTNAADSTRIAPSENRAPRMNPDRQMMASVGFGDSEVEAVYLEGDVVMTQGPNMIRAQRLYYDFVNERAVILDAVVRANLEERNLPLYLRAAEIRQLSPSQFSATTARVTTSEFYTPHYHIGAGKVELTNRTLGDPAGRQIGLVAGSFRIDDATLNILGKPVAYWPSLRGNVDTSETAIQSLRIGYSDDFGAEFESDWNLFSLLGLETPPGFSSDLSLDYFSERGPAIGVDVDYERENYYGLVKSYLIHDAGEDSLGDDRETEDYSGVRGRFLTRHRQYFEDDWEFTLELSYISDSQFLEEFFESEYDNGKEQETLLRLKKQRDNWAFAATLQARILDFTTQTERYPDFAFFVEGKSLADRLTWFSENRLGLLRYSPDDPTFRELLRDGGRDSSGTVGRADSRQELESPLDLGPVRLVPFLSGRATAWDDSPEDGGLVRGFGSYGVRSSMYLWRLYPEYKSDLWDMNGLRHVMKFDATAWMSHTNYDSDELYPFDDPVEGIDEVDGATIGLRQRFQTKRGEGANRRSVDVVSYDVEIGAFNDAPDDAITNGFASYSRPEDSVARNFINIANTWRINDRTAMLAETNYDLNDGKVDVYNLSVVVERPPRLSYLIGYRFIDPTDSNLLAFDLNYQLTEKHTFALRERFDLDRGRTLDFTIGLVRRLPRWFTAITFEIDEGEDDFGVSFSLWPEGLSKAVLGSKRFTGLANSTSIQND